MREDLPNTIRESLYDLSPDAIVRLFRLELADRSSVFLLSPYEETTWQGKLYSSIPCQMTEIEQDSDGKVSRPKFSFVNPEGIFTSAIHSGKLDGAQLTRYRILRGDLEADLDNAITETFRISRVMSVTRSLVVTEMRDILDGHSFKIPARAFYPPEFPHVQLG